MNLHNSVPTRSSLYATIASKGSCGFATGSICGIGWAMGAISSLHVNQRVDPSPRPPLSTPISPPISRTSYERGSRRKKGERKRNVLARVDYGMLWLLYDVVEMKRKGKAYLCADCQTQSGTSVSLRV